MFTVKNMKKLGVIFLSICVLVCALGCWIGVFSPSTSTEIADAATYDSYYANLNENLTGTAFRAELASLITSTHKYNPTYDELRNIFDESDADPNKSGNILWFYTGTSVSFTGSFNTGTNREHVWPKNAGNAFPEESEAGSDAHHLRPANSSLNSTRSNNSFGEVPQTVGNIVKENGSSSYDNLCYQANDTFYPGEGYRGVTARILMYVQTRWGDKYNLSFVLGNGYNKTIGDIEDLFKWHLEEPPTAEEIARNEAVYAVQGNRNPFIDHPEYAEMIYCHDGKSYNDELQACVEKYGSYLDDEPAVEITSLSVSPTTETLTVGASTKLSVSAYPTGASKAVTWTSSNPNVASVNNGTITAISAGTTTITATSTTNTAIKATATITVKAVSTIEITGTPTKTTYTAGDKFNPAGLTITATYTDKSTEVLPTTSCQWLDGSTRSTTLSEGTTSVICKYGSIEKTIDGITVEKATSTSVTFTFGDNGTEGHTDGSNLGSSKTYTEGNYTLALTSATSIFGPATDAMGNSALKIGTSSKTGSFTFTVPNDVTSVEIHVAQYKANATKITINGTAYTVNTASNNGAYTAYKVDTTSTKTVTFATASGGVRCMIDKIVYVIAGSSTPTHTHTPSSWIVDTPATCTTNGSRHIECTECKEVIDAEEISYNGHSFSDWTATDDNKESRTCSVCGHTETRDAENQGGGTETPGGDTPGGGNQGGNEGGDEVNQELIASFNTAVDAAQSATTMSEKFSAIKTALSLYNQMNNDEKALATGAFADLEDVIDAYNNAATVVNNESNKATENAIMLFAGTFSVLAFAAYFLLRRQEVDYEKENSCHNNHRNPCPYTYSLSSCPRNR